MAITQDYVSTAGIEGNDYKGATFTDGSFANATLTLTKAGAFTATKVNHWLYLTDNGSGEVTTGYYRVTSIAGAPNAVVLHADIRSGANDPTDVKCTQHAGTTLLPWRSLQGAFDLLTRSAADGNQVNLKAGTAQVNAATLDLTTFIAGGALSTTAPLIIRGYTAAANDDGIGEIDCNGASMWAATTYDDIVLVDLEIHSFGDNFGIYLDLNISLFRCEVHKGASSPSGKYLLRLGDNCRVIGCYIHDAGDAASRCISASLGVIERNYIVVGTGATGQGIVCSGSIVDNIVVCGATGQNGIQYTVITSVVGNAIYNTTAGTGNGIFCSSGNVDDMVKNNVIVGFSGAGGDGVNVGNILLLGYNAFYNCTNTNTIGDQKFIDLTANDVALAADPFTSAATGDFSLTDAAKTALRSLGWPASYLGAHANTDPHVTIGPMQYGPTPATAGGGGFPILGGSVVR